MNMLTLLFLKKLVKIPKIVVDCQKILKKKMKSEVCSSSVNFPPMFEKSVSGSFLHYLVSFGMKTHRIDHAAVGSSYRCTIQQHSAALSTAVSI